MADLLKSPSEAPPLVVRPLDGPGVLDLRGGVLPGRAELRLPAGDVLVVSGLPGSGKSTLIGRAVPGAAVPGTRRGAGVWRVDSQDSRERWARWLPASVPYATYRPLVRVVHYLRLRQALRTGAAVVVHDCGSQAWVRRWLARDARRRGRGLHLVLLDVPPEVALDGQAERGRWVSDHAFARHRRAVGRLVDEAGRGCVPRGCAAAVMLDRRAATALHTISFGGDQDP
ncbi:AAA family ATPase [Actinomadura vinacea]|uniref:AAA family ATPase n=1 Tax=Actinomadura vinacea TaxID=115336 RepID=A0ABN3J7F3_9ACTN